ncbi:MAG: ATP-binding protein [Candidatus Scalindua sp.]|nr:ATP-binding protein [Candidatus Scalindua sp.]
MIKTMNIQLPEDIQLRPTYLERVKPFIGKNIIKVFTGQRRVGKSYLLFQLIRLIREQEPQAGVLYINKEDLAFSTVKTGNDLNDFVLAHKRKSGRTYVFIDEIQEIVHFDEALRSLLLHSDIDLYCTGSNANLLSADVAGYLSGRAIEITVYSLSYEEFLLFHKLNNTPPALEKYIKYGGLPYLKHLELTDAIVFEYLKNIYSTIVYRDIINRYAIRNVPFLEQLVLFLAGNVGSLFSAKKISDFLKSQQVNIAPNQVQTYIQYLVNAFLVHKVQRYDIIGKRVFEFGEKYYFENLGIRHGLWGYRIEDRGKIIENTVYNYLLFKGYSVKVGVLGSTEIDFVGEKDGEKRYIQVALTMNETKTIEREFGNLQKISDNYAKEVVTLDDFQGNTFKGIKQTNLRSFLME